MSEFNILDEARKIADIYFDDDVGLSDRLFVEIYAYGDECRTKGRRMSVESLLAEVCSVVDVMCRARGHGDLGKDLVERIEIFLTHRREP